MPVTQYYFIRKQNRVYCGKCGKMMLQDNYNLKRHAISCGFSTGPEALVLEENADHAYLFEASEDRKQLYFLVMIPTLIPTAVYKDRYCGTRWTELFRATFSQGSKTVREEGLYNLDFWFKRMADSKKLPSLSAEEDVVPMKAVFTDILAFSSYGSFLDIYRNKGYSSRRPISDARADLLLTCHLFTEKEIQDSSSVTVRGKLWTYKGKPLLQLGILTGKNCREELGILLSEGYAHSNRECSALIRYLLATPYLKVENRIHPDVIRQFDEACPSFLLSRYLANGGRNVLIPLLCATYDKCMELLSKACIPQLAETLKDLKEHNPLPLYKNNIPDIFGLPVKTLRRIASYDLAKEKNALAMLKDVHETNPRFLSLSCYGFSSLDFLECQNINRRKDFQPMPRTIRQINSWSRDDQFRTLKYLNRLDKENEDASDWDKHAIWNLYRDYLNTCSSLNQYVDGKWPKDLRASHDKAANLYYQLKNEHLFESFRQAVSQESYLALTTNPASEDEEDPFQKDPYFILAPKETGDMAQESLQMHNCVKSYLEMVATRRTLIFFLREKKAPEKSVCTIEVRPNRQIIQVKAFANSKPTKKIRDFVRKWATAKELTFNTYDMDER